MTTHDLVKLIDECEKKYEDYIFVRMYGDGSGGLYADESNDTLELVTWDEETEMEKTIKGWLRES